MSNSESEYIYISPRTLRGKYQVVRKGVGGSYYTIADAYNEQAAIMIIAALKTANVQERYTGK